MREQTKIQMERRRQIIKDWSRNSGDWVSTRAVLFSDVVVFPGDSDEAGRRLKAIREKRRRWLLRLFPNEEWRAPLMTSMLMEEAGRCYTNGAHYATVAMCQAVTESLLRRQAGGSEEKYHKLLDRLLKSGTLSRKEKRDLHWLASIRNPSLHTGGSKKYARALARALTPVISRGKLTERMPIELDCKRALKIAVSLLHHHCRQASS